jgi:plasmid stability protein
MPDDLRERLAAQAKENGRSLNAEILAILQQGSAELSAIDSGALLEEVMRRFGKKINLTINK